ncbi:MAG: type II secretion system F family protein [Bdellovibrionaceae bacterium]|nr:type II secretion system F family protein [Pseudobdellovibrionaceae bacterium]
MWPAVAICVFVIAYYQSEKVLRWLHARSLGQKDEIVRYMELMFVEVNDKKLTWSLILISVGLGLIFFILFWPNIIVGFIVGSVFTLIGWTLPKHLFKSLYEKRCNRFVDQMVDGTTILANGIRAGLSVTQAMDRVSKNLKNPISQEFRLVLSQNQLGRPIEECLNELGERIPRQDVQMFVTAVNILKETGGNMAETFQTINFTIRERQKIEKKIEALTAQGVMQGIIISLVPFVILMIFYFIDPNYVMPMFTTAFGWMFLLLVFVLIGLGGLFIKKIITIKV